MQVEMTETTPLFHDLVVRHAASAPDAVAVEYGDRSLTYAELVAASAALARKLLERGVAPGTLVGVLLRPSVELPVAILATVLAGGAWLPLDPSYPAERLRYMVADSGLRVLIAEPGAAAMFPDVEAVDPARREGGATAPEPLVGPADLAYVIYTSGSTGRPKGVEVTHGGLANLVAAQRAAFPVGPDSRVLLFAPTSFDASVFELAMALAFGGTAVLAARETIAPGPGLADFLRDNAITHLTLPPSVLATLPPADLPDLTMLVCAGEALSEHLVDQWAPGRRMFNAYGPTEATVWATVAEVLPQGGKPSIGHAVRGAHVTVLDELGRPAGIGVPGELAIGGRGVARGYHARPRLTAERFVPDPAGDVPGARIYLTGDRAVQHADGGLEFLGRLDHQVKIRGFRIEPDEIANRLVEHHSVADAVVVARDDGAGPRLVGYATGFDLDPVKLRRHLANVLPAYMVPSAIVPLAEMPLTPSGKIDRAALPTPVSPGEREYVRPGNATERALAGILADLLGVSRVGVREDFFALGGHSLLAGRLAARVRTELGRELPLREIHRARTIAGMAGVLDNASADDVIQLPPIEVADHPIGGPAPLSFPQERIWFLETLSPGNLAYNAQATLRLHGALNVDVLRATLNEIIRRHQVFHSAFRTVEGSPVQIPLAPQTVPVPVADLSAVPADEREQRADELVARTVAEPFDLARPPLVRWLLIRFAADDHMLVHVEHHLVHDGWSFAVFVDELRTLYPELLAGRPSPLPKPAVQYLDFVDWQRNWMRGPALDRYLEHWTAELAGCPPALNLATDRPRPPTQSFAGAALRIDLPGTLCRRLRVFSRARAVTLFTTMLAGFATLLARYSGQQDLVIGSGLANRRLAEVERMLGMVVNTVPLRLNLGGWPDFDELVHGTHDVVGRASEWQDVPLDRLVNALALPRDPSRNPLFQVMFSFHDSQIPELDFAGLTGSVLERHNGSAKTDINVVVIPRAEQRLGHGSGGDDAPITVIWEYATDLFDAETMRTMVERFQRLLSFAVASPAKSVDRLPLLTAEQRHEIVRKSRGADRPYPAHRTIAELFADQVVVRAGEPAVVDGDRTLTYAELDERANRIAHLLRAAGVARDVPVGVLLPRGADLVVTVLAVIKAGGAYVPLDPGYPSARLRTMVADVNAPVVVSTAGLRDRQDIGVPVLALDESAGRLAEAPATPPPCPATPDSLAYALFTSGSTGRPKGVLVEHRSVVRLVCGTDFMEFGPTERIAQIADTAFDAFTFELWGSLLNGGRLCVVPSDRLLSSGGLGAAISEHRITSMFLTSALFTEVMTDQPRSFAGMRNLIVGGDVVHVDRARKLLDLDPGTRPLRLLNGYGPTETTTFAVVHDIRELPPGADSVPIGRPIANTIAYVLDAHLEPVADGVVGELYLGGPGVARGYAGRPTLTAERFTPDPFAADGSRMYRTGDLARYLPDGTLEFLGRTDDQVKIRGLRIEPSELEVALTAHPKVAQAAVLVEGESSQRRLIAYLVPVADAGELTAGALRDFLAGTLPPYLLPAAYVVLSAMPMTASGKIDRGRLADAGDALTFDDYRPPTTPTERELAGLIADAVQVGRVGVTDDFFRLGGNSLLAMRLVARINERFATRVKLRQFLRNPTVAALAAEVDSSMAAMTAPTGPGAPLASAAIDADERLLDRLDELSDIEVATLLNDMAEKEVDR